MPNTQTMDESLASTWKDIQKKYAVEDEPVPDAEPEPEVEADAEQQPEGGERPRDESGKFVKQEKDDGAKGEGEAERADAREVPRKDGKAASQDRAQPRETQERPALDVKRAPSSWKPTVRAEWPKLPEPVRAEILRREQDFQNGQQQVMPDAHFGRAMRETIAPYRMLIEAEGGTPERAVADLMRTAAIFRVGTPQQKYQAIAQIANQFGLDLRVFSQQPQGQQPTQQQTLQDPRVDQLLAHQRQEAAERQQREQTELENQVTSWMEQMDGKGESKYPYLADVIADMSALIPQIRAEKPHLTTAQVLEEGYQRAIWAHPEVRTVLQREAASAREAKQRADSQSRVREARRAASVNVPRRASLPSPGKPGRIEDTLRETAREVGFPGFES